MAVEALATPIGAVNPSLLLEIVWATRLALTRDRESIKAEAGRSPWRRDRL
jgi:hypothetical protein